MPPSSQPLANAASKNAIHRRELISSVEMIVDNTTILWWTAGVNVVAILAAPAVALWIQRKVDRKKAFDDRRQQIFRALWVNRMRDHWIARIDALNMIDVEFFKEKHIRDLWEDLFAHYKNPPPGISEAEIRQQRIEKYSKLLFEISNTLGYNFGHSYIRDNVYRPELHNSIDSVEYETKLRILELLKSDALPVRFVTPQDPQSPPSPQ
jgi:hypothetical protein